MPYLSVVVPAFNESACIASTIDRVRAAVDARIAAYAAARDLVHRVPFCSRRLQAVLALVILVVALGWALRSAGLHYHMRRMAFLVRNDWVNVEPWLEWQHASPSTPAGTRLVRYLRENALNRSVTNPFFFPQMGAAVDSLNAPTRAGAERWLVLALGLPGVLWRAGLSCSRACSPPGWSPLRTISS